MIKIEFLKSPHSFSANCYLISSNGEYAVIDPSAPFDKSLCDGVVKYILLTHAHFDHILEVDSWVNNTNAKVIISADEVDALSNPIRNCFKLYDGTERGYFGPAEPIYDGDKLSLGDCEIKFISTPGHTVGGGVYLCENIAFVGDTIFEGGGYGRHDLPTSSYVMLRNSIARLLELPDETVVYSGHGPSTTIKQYKHDIGR